jgi:tRNA threonylcarbamoyladenosine biosynthesis protein TsaE
MRGASGEEHRKAGKGATLIMQFVVDQSGQVDTSLPDELATLELGAKLARALHSGLIVYLKGELGAGKTTLVRGVLRGLGYAGKVKSPTYALVEVYDISSLYLHHFDFYRLKHPTEFIEAGLRDMFGGESVCLVEWPEQAQGVLPGADLEIVLEHRGSGRAVHLQAQTKAGIECLRQTIA